MDQSVFYDPRQSRWKRLRTVFDVLGLALMLLVIFFVYSALRGQPLPGLLLPTEKKPYHALKENEKEKAKERRRLAVKRGHLKSSTRDSQIELNTDQGLRAAFYVPWDAASYSSLREY